MFRPTGRASDALAQRRRERGATWGIGEKREQALAAIADQAMKASDQRVIRGYRSAAQARQ